MHRGMLWGLHRDTDQVITLSVELGEEGFSAPPCMYTCTHMYLSLSIYI